MMMGSEHPWNCQQVLVRGSAVPCLYIMPQAAAPGGAKAGNQEPVPGDGGSKGKGLVAGGWFAGCMLTMHFAR